VEINLGEVLRDNPEVEGNTIGAGAACSGNSSVSNDGQPNKVTGARTGQCATI
jgi:stage V sporulation protein SpoVS